MNAGRSSDLPPTQAGPGNPTVKRDMPPTSAARPHRLGRRLALALVAAGVLLLSALSLPAPAAADARGCTPASFGMTCVDVVGTSTEVYWVRAERFKADPEWICDHNAQMWVNDKNGRRIDTRWSGRYRGCSIGVAWHRWSPSREYPNKSRLCIAFYERGQQQGGAACVKIKKWPWD